MIMSCKTADETIDAVREADRGGGQALGREGQADGHREQPQGGAQPSAIQQLRGALFFPPTWLEYFVHLSSSCQCTLACTCGARLHGRYMSAYQPGPHRGRFTPCRGSTCLLYFSVLLVPSAVRSKRGAMMDS